ncbi:MULTISPECIES: hypothetical protein [Thermoanaerobacterium]|uniref:Uncharacterized protein n=2 Tax=Thermoanaerobacterium TaxID=28895 RepID=W9EIC8_9THEO|nr:MULTISPECIES: hypothetical protein [Thermoanaerobacterium]AFK85481.1 hypothetical protein Tsac_0451 [Thermoanaerobacterium saccharolyticum JW/SL-YS485]ETO39439.1 hypothetical protein V518_0479 [Thermoanaerobacterium aotearoense SCUT27]
MIPYDKYKNLDEFIIDIDDIGEIIFKHLGKEYSLYFDGEKVFISESCKQETEQVFNGIDDFINNFILDGEPIKDIVTELDVVSH